jgi:MFS family permease
VGLGDLSAAKGSSRGAWTLLAAIVGSGMSFIDGTAVNVALPVMQRDLHATSAQLQWVVEGYSLFLSALILIGG